MIANYQYINDEQLNFLKNSDSKEKDVLEEVEEMNEESEMLLDRQNVGCAAFCAYRRKQLRPH